MTPERLALAQQSYARCCAASGFFGTLYDLFLGSETPTAWYWARVDATFHEFRKFGMLRFGE